MAFTTNVVVTERRIMAGAFMISLTHNFFVKYGFHLFSVGQSKPYESPNLLSAKQQPLVVDQKLAKELATHRFAGPFDTPPFPIFRVSPLGIVPKKTPRDFRMIHHLSYPRGKSVNDGISHEHSSVHYADIDMAITRIKQSGVGLVDTGAMVNGLKNGLVLILQSWSFIQLF